MLISSLCFHIRPLQHSQEDKNRDKNILDGKYKLPVPALFVLKYTSIFRILFSVRPVVYSGSVLMRVPVAVYIKLHAFKEFPMILLRKRGF